MANLVERFLPLINWGRQKLVDVGLRPTRLYRRANAWSTGELLLGTLTATDVEITPRPLFEGDDFKLTATNITPSYSGGGYDPDDLLPDAVVGSETVYIVQQVDGTLIPYRLVEVHKLDPFRFSLSLERISRTKPEDY